MMMSPKNAKYFRSDNLPMMLPSAHTACSHTFWWGEWSSLKNKGTASKQNTHTHTRKTRHKRSDESKVHIAERNAQGLEGSHLTGFDYSLRLCRGPRRDVSQSPGSLELQRGTGEREIHKAEGRVDSLRNDIMRAIKRSVAAADSLQAQKQHENLPYRVYTRITSNQNTTENLFLPLALYL